MKNVFERITVNPRQCGGRPCVRGMRIRVSDVLDLFAAGLEIHSGNRGGTVVRCVVPRHGSQSAPRATGRIVPGPQTGPIRSFLQTQTRERPVNMSAKKVPPATVQKHRILLVDDHAIVREGFAELINSRADLEVCGQAGSAAQAMTAVERLHPELVVVDLTLQGGSGLDLIKNLKALHPMLHMLVLSMHDETLYAERALRAGALGYVMKREETSVFLQAIHDVLQGRVFLSPPMRERMLHKAVGGNVAFNHSGMAHLTDRELEVFQMIGEGRATRQIAKKLQLSISTVETHRAHLKEKLHLNNGTELIRRAVEWASSN